MRWRCNFQLPQQVSRRCIDTAAVHTLPRDKLRNTQSFLPAIPLKCKSSPRRLDARTTVPARPLLCRRQTVVRRRKHSGMHVFRAVSLVRYLRLLGTRSLLRLGASTTTAAAVCSRHCSTQAFINAFSRVSSSLAPTRVGCKACGNCAAELGGTVNTYGVRRCDIGHLGEFARVLLLMRASFLFFTHAA